MRTTTTSRILLIAGIGIATTGLAGWCSMARGDDPACRTDLDGDLEVGSNDLGQLLASWGDCESAECPGDFDGDDRIDGWDLGIMFAAWGPIPTACLDGPTLAEPFHMPTLTDASTLDIVVLEDWHVDRIDGTTRQKLIEIHVDDWWDEVEIRVPVRLVVPRNGPAKGFVINGSGLNEDSGRDQDMTASDRVAIDAGAGVVTTKIKSLGYYPALPPESVVRGRFAETLDWRYSEYYL